MVTHATNPNKKYILSNITKKYILSNLSIYFHFLTEWWHTYSNIVA